VSAAGDRCKISLVNRSPSCSETQPLEAVPAGDAWTVSTTGISACDPLGCTFGEGDEGCQLLDRAGSWGETIVIGETQFTTTRSGDGTICSKFSLPMITTWTKE
jgi:hypothetical protein